MSEAIGFDDEGDINQCCTWSNGIPCELKNIRKDKSVESQAKLVNVVDADDALVEYETMIFDNKQNCIKKYTEIEELVYAEDMNVWMFQ